MDITRKNYPLQRNNALYPNTVPYRSGMMEVGEGHAIYWEACGNPKGKPVVILHGGPGSGASPSWRRYFDPALYNMILFDQRGCGRSVPHAGDTPDALIGNTTGHLIADMEKLRSALGIDSWMLFGGSWGTTLALAYAVTHPLRVTQMVLWSVVTTRKEEVDWLTWSMGRIFPQEFERLTRPLPGLEEGMNIPLAYNKLLMSKDPAVHMPASLAWCDWEDRIVALGNAYPRSEEFADERFRLGFARLVTHYFGNYAFLPDDYITGQLDKIRHIPLVMVRGRLDIAAALRNPWQLHKALPGSDLYILGEEGHGGAQEMVDILAGAIAFFASM